MASVPWLASLTSEKVRSRKPLNRLCLIVAVSILGVYFFIQGLSLLFHERHKDVASSVTDHDPTDMTITRPNPSAPLKRLSILQPDSSNKISWDYARYNDKKEFGDRPQQTFHSDTVKTPYFQANTFKPRATEGNPYFFLTPAVDGMDANVQIFSRKDLSLVYSQSGFRATNNFRMQEYRRQQFLTFWEGKPAPGHGLGTGLLYDNEYNLAHNISINVFDSSADSHEFQLTEDGGALFSIYETVRDYDMTPVGGPKDGVLQDSCFEEVDIATGKTRFSWRASDWFSVSETEMGYNDESDYGHPTHREGWDFFHINSLEKTKDGNYLVSGRRLNLLTLIDGKTGAPIWQIGGKNNQYKDLSDGQATNFKYQHHARFDNEEETEIVLFDNAHYLADQPTPDCKDKCSRAMHIRMDHHAKTAELVKSYFHPLSAQARAEGSAERQPNGNVLVGWGKVPGFTEYDRDGEVLLDVQTGPFAGKEGGNSHVYRIYSMDWKGYPTWDPKIALFEGAAYVSWNGATEQTYWALYTGDSEDKLQIEYVVYRGGFETKLSLPENGNVLARVAALDSAGEFLGSTPLLNLTSGKTMKATQDLQMTFYLDWTTIV